MAALLALVFAITGAHTPQAAVKRFIQPSSPADACWQLAPAYRAQIQAQYGPCVAGVAQNPKATRLVISHVVVNGTSATLQADYRVPSGAIEEHYSLAKQNGVWLITAAS